MPDFANFQAGSSGTRWSDIVARPFEPRDVRRCADLLSRREAWTRKRAMEAVSRWTGFPHRQVFVAEHQGRGEGYGKLEWLMPSENAGDAPTGWYLSGLLVAPDARRRGVGRRLTLERIRWVQPRTPELWFFVNRMNRASVALHEELGFILHTTDFHIPGVSFTDGAGALYRLVLP